MNPARGAGRRSRNRAARDRRRLVGLGLLVLAMLVVLQLWTGSNPSRNTVLSRMDAVWYDWRFQLWPPQRDDRIPIVIVDLDEATQQREGRWPWDRRKVAELITALQVHGAALVGFDVVFSEAGLNPVRQILDQAGLPGAIRTPLNQWLAAFDGDAALADVLGDHTVLGYFFHADGASTGVLPAPFLVLPEDQVAASTLLSMPDYTASLPVLMDSALASGFVVAVPDADGIVRRVPLVMRHGDGIYASLSLEIARLALAAPWLRLQQVQQDDRTIITGVRVGRHLQVPLDPQGNMLVPYKGGARTFPTVSATGVLRGDAPEDLLARLDGAIVLVGTSALGLSDLRTIPLQTAYPGVEVHANMVDAMLQAALLQAQASPSAGTGLLSEALARVPWLSASLSQDSPFYVRPDWEPAASLILLLVVGMVLAVGLPGRAPVIMITATGVWLLAVIALNVLAWHVWHLVLPLALQVVAVVIIGGLNVAGGYVVATRQRRTIESLFGEYVPAGHVQRMLQQPEQVNLEGEQRRMTVLFADVRNFTALSESLSATELKQVLNRYLSAITAVIFEHHGTIDKYVGDLVMAFWNAPLDDPDHALHAVQAGLAMQQRMRHLREEFQRDGLPSFHIGIGINTGLMNVGDMGSRYRRAYTVLGDSVNLASRLEGLTSYYQVPILVSDATRAEAPSLLYRSVDRVRVKGRQQALDVFQPLDAGAAQDAELARCQIEHERALADYRAGHWAQARQAFIVWQQAFPEDPLPPLYLQRMGPHADGPPSTEWDAVHVHEVK